MKKHLSLFFLYYLRFFARLQIQKVKLINPNLKIIGVTGSAGKTSTILACEAALKPNFKVKTTAGSNSESGIPLNILDLKTKDYSPLDWFRLAIFAPIQLFVYWPKFDVYLVEMGIDAPYEPKNMDFLLSIIKPQIGIFLNVTPVHMENFSSQEAIAAEKAKLVNFTQIAIINQNDPLVSKFTTNKNIIPIIPVNIKFDKYLLPDVYQTSFGAAIALAKILKIDQKKAVENIRNHFYLPPGRSSIFKGINNSTIIDSSYNSSPLATLEMLKFLASFPSPRIAVLGDMRELGASSKNSHQDLYQSATKYADIVISVGPETQKYFGPKAQKFPNWWSAAEFLKKTLPANATILVKGSQNTIYLEELVKQILKNPSDAKFLCRQSPYWLNLKKKFLTDNS